MQLSHENVVKVYNWGKFNGRYAMIMEFVDGKNLNEFIHEPGKYGFNTLVEIGYRIACGLVHIHSHGIVHKDIKPENVLVSNDLKTVKITDFGIAKVPKNGGRGIFLIGRGVKDDSAIFLMLLRSKKKAGQMPVPMFTASVF